MTRIAYASGFQSLRRFNSLFRERYRLSPSALRRGPRTASTDAPAAAAAARIRLTLAYRAPLDWASLLGSFSVGKRCPGSSWWRTAGTSDRSDSIGPSDSTASPAWSRPSRWPTRTRARGPSTSTSRPRSCRRSCRSSRGSAGCSTLTRSRRWSTRSSRAQGWGGGSAGAGASDSGVVRWARRGAPGAPASGRSGRGAPTGTGSAVGRVADALGEAIETELPGLVRLVPTAERVAGAGAPFLAQLGLPPRSADAIVAIARAVTDGALPLEPGTDVPSTLRALSEVAGVGERTATAIVMRALQWPDAFSPSDVSLQRAAGVTGTTALRRAAERWRPWRAYAAAHLALRGARR